MKRQMVMKFNADLTAGFMMESPDGIRYGRLRTLLK